MADEQRPDDDWPEIVWHEPITLWTDGTPMPACEPINVYIDRDAYDGLTGHFIWSSTPKDDEASS